MDTSGYELSDLEDIEICGESPQVELDAVFRSGIDTSSSQTAFNDLEMGEGGSSEKPIVLEAEEDKENSSPTTPVSECLIEPLRLHRFRLFQRLIDFVTDFLYRNLFQ